MGSIFITAVADVGEVTLTELTVRPGPKTSDVVPWIKLMDCPATVIERLFWPGELSGENAWKKRPMSTNIDTSQENDQSHPDYRFTARPMPWWWARLSIAPTRQLLMCLRHTRAGMKMGYG